MGQCVIVTVLCVSFHCSSIDPRLIRTSTDDQFCHIIILYVTSAYCIQGFSGLGLKGALNLLFDDGVSVNPVQYRILLNV